MLIAYIFFFFLLFFISFDKLYIFNFLDFFYSSPNFFFFGFFFFLTSLFSLLFFNYLGFYGIFFLNFFSIFFFWFSIIPFLSFFFSNNYYFYLNLGRWLFLGGNLRINLDFFFDNVSVSFFFLTLTIGLCVYIYSFSYFRYEPNVERLVIFLNFFMISMIFLVSSSNFVSLFLGWELIGITSFLLINFWVTRINTFKSSFKAFSFNKSSDAFLLFSIFLIFNKFFTLDINVFLSQLHVYSSVFVSFLSFKFLYLDLICFFFLLCAFIKSAQFGPHIWLPDSMEAPVPASSLIHSATLVSAGVFLLLRFFPLFEFSFFSFYIVSFLGSLTAFLGGIISMHQSDTKKILAYSTISHCGFLMVVSSTGVLEYCILYLYIHGFFKALVFMSVGNINRLNKNIQDFKKMGNFFKYLPFEFFFIFVGLINLSGLPFSLGFYIKHLLFFVLNSNSFHFYFVFVNIFFASITGIFYSFRLFYNIFFDFKKSRFFLYRFYNNSYLYSKFYSNSSLASNFSIFFLFLLSYTICIYILILYSSEFFVFSDFFSFNLINLNYLNLNASFDFLLNFFFLIIFLFFLFFFQFFLRDVIFLLTIFFYFIFFFILFF